MNNYSVIQISSVSNNSGQLYVLEKQDMLPFQIKRVYYITNVAKKTIRGKHAHKQLKQLMMCVGGSCDIMLDDGKEKTKVTLDNPGKLLYIQPCMWREIINFSDNATLIVFASAEYDEKDYIRNYGDFQKYIGESR